MPVEVSTCEEEEEEEDKRRMKTTHATGIKEKEKEGGASI